MDFELSYFDGTPEKFWKDISFELIPSIFKYLNIDMISTEISSLIRKYYENKESDVYKVFQLFEYFDKNYK